MKQLHLWCLIKDILENIYREQKTKKRRAQIRVHPLIAYGFQTNYLIENNYRIWTYIFFKYLFEVTGEIQRSKEKRKVHQGESCIWNCLHQSNGRLHVV